MAKLLNKIALLMPLLIIMILVNYAGDPAHLFSGGRYEAGIADILLGGKNVAGISDYDERLLIKYLVDGSREKTDILVIGSSRSMLIDKDLFPGKTFYNASVSGATFEDYLGIYGLYREASRLPAILILGIDPWVFNHNNEEVRWKTLQSQFNAIVSVMGGRPSVMKMPENALMYRVKRLSQIVSPAYFKPSLTELQKRQRSSGYYATSCSEQNDNVKRADGSLSYDIKMRTQSEEDTERKADAYAVQNPIYLLDKFHELDSSVKSLFVTFLRQLQRDNVKLVFLLNPYHPKVYKVFSQSDRYKLVLETEKYIRKIAQENEIPLIGSFDPRIYNLDSAYFFDGMHLRSTGIQKILLSASSETFQ